LLETFQPRYHFHGHVHLYHPDAVIGSRLGKTTVINTYRHRVTKADFRKGPPKDTLSTNEDR
jgi:hypothetical protein